MAVVNLEFRCRENAARIAERIRTPAHDHTQGSDHLRLVTLTGICFFRRYPYYWRTDGTRTFTSSAVDVACMWATRGEGKAPGGGSRFVAPPPPPAPATR